MAKPRGIPLLRLEGIGRSYGGADVPTAALQDVNLEICEGDFVAIIGPSGSGKSTLLNILGLLDRASEGTYFINGADVSRMAEKQRDLLRSRMFGFVFQASHVMLDESSARNAALGLRVQGVRHVERELQVTQALGRVGLLHRTDVPGKNLSGGERQRLALARALATKPRILFADEPTGNLDSVNTQSVIADLRALNQTGVTVVVITHDPIVAAAANRQVVINDGRLEQPDARSSPGPARHEPRGGRPDSAEILSGAHFGRRVNLLADDVYDALASLTSRTGKALLLILAFMLGSGGLVASVGLSQSASAQVSERLAEAALDELQASRSPSGAQPGNPDLAGLRAQQKKIAALHGVVAVGLRVEMATSEFRPTRFRPTMGIQEDDFAGSLLAADSTFLELSQAVVEPASALSLLDESFGKPVAIVGHETATRLGIPSAGPGQKIWIGGQPVPVVGILHQTGRNPVLADSIILGMGAYPSAASDNPVFVVRTLPGFPAPLADVIPLALDAAHPEHFTVNTVADLRSLRRGVNNDLGVLISVISWVLLALACLSAATSMYLTVQTRRPEIALRRALGTSRMSIGRMFILEGLLVGLGGGLAGGAVGVLAVVAFCLSQEWTPVLGPESVWTGVIAGAATGVLSALYPAIAASRADPAQAIRA
jgi:macrolide transport system ATP-binding/permease protein